MSLKSQGFYYERIPLLVVPVLWRRMHFCFAPPVDPRTWKFIPSMEGIAGLLKFASQPPEEHRGFAMTLELEVVSVDGLAVLRT